MNSVKRFFIVTLLLGSGVIGAKFIAFESFAEGPRDSATIYRQLGLFGEVFEQIRDIYVDVPDEKALIESAIKGMLTGLDPHSDYMTAEEFERMQTSTAGEFGGLGIQFTMEDGLVKIITTIDNTPAAAAGLLGGDFITHIDGVSAKGLSSEEAADRMRGEVNTKINLTVFRPSGAGKSFDVEIIRALIENNPVTMRLEDKVIYLRVSQFNAKASEQLEQAMKKALDEIALKNIDGVILDLRNNGGGYLNQAVDMTDLFLEQGEIVTTRGREVSQIERHSATDGDIIDKKPLVVLINGGSASASEIVAGALQDHKRATLIGTRSFGKGSVQRIVPLDRGLSGALRVTTGRYYTPSGRSIQAKGIDPDVEVNQPLPDDLSPEQVNIGGEASLRGHINASSGDKDEAAAVPAPSSHSENKNDGDNTDETLDEARPITESDDDGNEDEDTIKGSPAYFPRDNPEADTQLQYALNMLRNTL